MTEDDDGGDVLAAARAAGARLDAAERELERARMDYHTAVRRLHLAGGTVREIAGALGVSHQRVQQIVQAAGGSWWSRTWRGRRAARASGCSFCGRPAAEVAKLVAGPDVCICDDCVSTAEEVLAGAGRRASRTSFAVVAGGARARCSFCGKTARAGPKIVVHGARRVCGACLSACRDIIALS